MSAGPPQWSVSQSAHQTVFPEMEFIFTNAAELEYEHEALQKSETFVFLRFALIKQLEVSRKG